MMDNAGEMLTSVYFHTHFILRLTRRERREVEYKETVYKLAKEHEKVCIIMHPP